MAVAIAIRDATAQELWVCDLGAVRYLDAVHIQEQVRARRQAGELPDTLLLVEHPPVYTLGRRAAREELPFSEDFYEARGIEVHECDRGGRVTYHGPGQLIGYPIVAVDDVHAYVRALESAIVAALEREGIAARARSSEGPHYTGVWVDERKIASIGVHVQRGVTTHGFAVNVCNALEPFGWIIACGLPGVSMTSLQRERGRAVDAESFRALVVESLCAALAMRCAHVAPAQLGLATTHAATASASEPPLEASAVPA